MFKVFEYFLNRVFEVDACDAQQDFSGVQKNHGDDLDSGPVDPGVFEGPKNDLEQSLDDVKQVQSSPSFYPPHEVIVKPSWGLRHIIGWIIVILHVINVFPGSVIVYGHSHLQNEEGDVKAHLIAPVFFGEAELQVIINVQKRLPAGVVLGDTDRRLWNSLGCLVEFHCHVSFKSFLFA